MSTLPSHPSLKHLKNEAKQLLKALKDGAADSAARVSEYLPRLNDADVDAVLAGQVTLQEAQHVLAKEYGFGTWVALCEATEPTFDQLDKLTDDQMRVLLREVDQKDLVRAIKDLTSGPQTLRTRLLMVMSQRVRLFILEELEFVEATPKEVADTRARIVAEARSLGARGMISWPPGSGTHAAAAPPSPPVELPAGLAVLRRPLEELSLDEIRQLAHGFARIASDKGVPELEHTLQHTASPFIREGVRLAVDGTEIDLVRGLMRARKNALLRDMGIRLEIIIEGMVSISEGDNPRIVTQRLVTVYSSDFDREFRQAEGTVVDVRRRLDEQPASATNHDELTMLVTDMAWIARRSHTAHTGGVAALRPLLDAIDDAFLKRGIELLSEYAYDAIPAELEPRRDGILELADQRYRLVTAAIAAAQEGRSGEALDEALDAALSEA